MNFFFENPKHEIYGIYGQSLAYAPHLHNHLELVGMIEGKAMAYVEEKVYEINSGDAFLSSPTRYTITKKLRMKIISCFFSPWTSSPNTPLSFSQRCQKAP